MEEKLLAAEILENDFHFGSFLIVSHEQQRVLLLINGRIVTIQGKWNYHESLIQ